MVGFRWGLRFASWVLLPLRRGCWFSVLLVVVIVYDRCGFCLGGVCFVMVVL